MTSLRLVQRAVRLLRDSAAMAALDYWLHARAVRVVLLGFIGLLGVIALLSFRWAFGYQAGNQRYEWFILQGNLYINTAPRNWVATHPGWTWTPGFAVHRARLSLPWISPPSMQSFVPGLWHVIFPLYIPIVILCVLALYPAIPFVRRRWRVKRGLCPNCGYDLTGNVSGRCPECGMEALGSS